MTAPYIIPFDNCPVSIDVKTGSYTVPTGSYARCLASVSDGGTFTIDTKTALRSKASTSWSVLASDNIPFVSSGQIATASAAVTSTGGGFNETTAYTSGTTDSAEFWLPEGTVINGTGTWSGTVMLYNKIT